MPGRTGKPPVDLDDQSYVLEDGSRTSKLVPKDAKYKPLYEGVETFYDIFLRGIQMSGNGPFLGTRSGPNQEYEWLSYQEVYDQSVAFGSWLLDQGIKGRSEEIIGIFSQNRKEVMLEHFITVTIFVAILEEDIEHSPETFRLQYNTLQNSGHKNYLKTKGESIRY